MATRGLCLLNCAVALLCLLSLHAPLARARGTGYRTRYVSSYSNYAQRYAAARCRRLESRYADGYRCDVEPDNVICWILQATLKTDGCLEPCRKYEFQGCVPHGQGCADPVKGLCSKGETCCRQPVP